MLCPFCHIINEDKDRVIKEYKTVFVIFSNPRLMKAHLLVIPKRHIEKPSQLTAEERQELFDTVLKYQDIILEKISSGCDIRQNCRPFQPESNLKVNHVHFHLQPRELYDELYQKSQIFEKEVFQQSTEFNNEIIKLL